MRATCWFSSSRTASRNTVRLTPYRSKSSVSDPTTSPMGHPMADMSSSIRFATFVAVLALPDVSRIDPGARRDSASCRGILRKVHLVHADSRDRCCTIPRTTRHLLPIGLSLAGVAETGAPLGESRRQDSTRGPPRSNGTEHTIELRHAPLGAADRPPAAGAERSVLQMRIVRPVEASVGATTPEKSALIALVDHALLLPPESKMCSDSGTRWAVIAA